MSTRKIIKGFASSGALVAVNFAVSLITLRMLLAFLPDKVAGLWMLYLSIAGYFIIFDLGVSPTLGREISFILGTPNSTPQESARRIANLIRSCMILFVGLGAFLLVASCVLGLPYLRAVAPREMWSSAAIAWFILITGGALNLIGEVWLAGLYGSGEISLERASRAIGQVMWLVLSYFALLLNTGIVGLAVAWLLQGVIIRLYARSRLRRAFPTDWSQIKFDREIVRRIVVPSAKYALMLIGGIVAVQTDSLVIAYVFGTAPIPAYQAIAKLVTAMMTLSMMLVITSSPFLSKAYAEGDHERVQSLLSHNLRVSLTVMIVLSAFFVGFADRIVNLWLGPGHFIGFPVVIALTVVMILETHHMSWSTAVVATGALPFVTTSLLAGALNIVWSLVLAHKLGIVGVALGTFAAQVTTNNWYIPFYGMRLFRIPLSRHLGGVVLQVLKVATTTGAAAYFVRTLTKNLSPILSIGAGVIAIGTVGLASGIYWVLNSSERTALFKPIRQRLLARSAR